MTTLSSRSLSQLWYNERVRGVLVQLMAISVLFLLVYFFAHNAILKLEANGQDYNFSFLYENANYDINQTLISYTSQSPHWRAGLVGLLNTLLVAFFGIIIATILGFVLGVLRLSNNWLVDRMAYCYIEYMRNVPVLLHILFIHGIIIHALPNPRNALSLGETLFLMNRGFYMPKPEPGPLFWVVFISLIVAIVLAYLYKRRAKRIQIQTGQTSPVFLVSLGLIIGLPTVCYLIAGQPIVWEIPALKGFNFQGGVVVRPEFVSLTLALSMYTAAFIAEIVRSGIQAVSRGQTEAAYALGMRPNSTLRLIVIPQALRVIIPPLSNQFLNLTKNSSLAIAIGYMDIVATMGGISLNQTGRALECMTIVLLIYLALSLIISSIMNWYNNRTKLVER